MMSSNTTCSAPYLGCFKSRLVCVFETKADTRGSSTSSSPLLLSQPCVLQTVGYPLCTLETNVDIWNISVSTPPYPTLQLDKIVLQLLSLFPASAVPATINPPNLFFNAERRCDIFSFSVTGKKKKKKRSEG